MHNDPRKLDNNRPGNDDHSYSFDNYRRANDDDYAADDDNHDGSADHDHCTRHNNNGAVGPRASVRRGCSCGWHPASVRDG